MLTEGWDCNTVTHVIGLRPFMSQLLCEQVVGRALRRASYELGANDRFPEEVAKVLGVPFEIVPFKAGQTPGVAKPKQFHIHALPEKQQYEIRFPRVERYGAAVKNRVTVEWAQVPPLTLDPLRIPDFVLMKANLPSNGGRPSLYGPGKVDEITLERIRSEHREQELAFVVAAALTKEYASSPACMVPPHALFPQLLGIAQRFLREKVEVPHGGDVRDLLLAPYYGWMVELLREAIRPDAAGGEAAEIAVYEQGRGDGSTAEVEFWTRREPVPVRKSHVNAVVPDTEVWEQSAAAHLDRHPAVDAFVKNAGLGFAIPYLHNGEDHDYVPDFIVRLAGGLHLVLETKGYDPLKEVKRAAAERWVAAVNAEGSKGRWAFRMVGHPGEVEAVVAEAARVGPSWLSEMYALAQQNREAAVDLMFREIDDLLHAGRFQECGQVLEAVDVEKLDSNLLVSALAVTKPAADAMPGRPAFVARVEERLRVLVAERADRLLEKLR
jgi:type III restriction enzyme